MNACCPPGLVVIEIGDLQRVCRGRRAKIHSRAADRGRALGAQFRAAYRAANGASTSLQAGDSDAALLEMHCTMRPPPGATPAQSVRMSAPQAERTMNSSSRGRSGRSAITAGAAAGAAPAGAAVAAAPPPPVAALTAFSQAGETLALFFSRHSRAGAPPGGT